MQSVPELIGKKRDGGVLTATEIRALVEGFVSGEVEDYQMAAFAMAVCIRGMDANETAALTEAMLLSGEVLKHPASGAPVVDKHSTGGIGDKTSIILAPLLACAGVRVPMLAGRGLGITGGTLDKLESIPGYRTDLSVSEIEAQLAEVGCVITGQTKEICPADRKLYALRDVTGTVPSRPLIVSSIMSKKLAESLDALVLDVKYGSGAFMRELAEAQLLANEMVAVGRARNVAVSCLLTPMNEPLGTAVGNALEVIEAQETLRGGGAQDLRTLTLDLAVRVSSCDRATLAGFLDNGQAMRKFQEMVAAQGGDPNADLAVLHRAPVRLALLAPNSGTLKRMDAGAVGHAMLILGAGRARADATIDPAVGLTRIVKTGTTVEAGQPLLEIHAATPDVARRVRNLLLTEAIEISR